MRYSKLEKEKGTTGNKNHVTLRNSPSHGKGFVYFFLNLESDDFIELICSNMNSFPTMASTLVRLIFLTTDRTEESAVFLLKKKIDKILPMGRGITQCHVIFVPSGSFLFL